MVTSWPKNSYGPGTTVENFAKLVKEISNNTLIIDVFASGEFVPPNQVFDSVSSNVADMAHTASFFWQGKIPASVFFTTVPFGLSPLQHQAWLEYGGGNTLWNHIYEDFNLVAMSCGNTGPSMGGWFRKPIKSINDIIGLKYRMPGLGGIIFSKLGSNTLNIPPAEILPALANKTIDATEFLCPYIDSNFGFFKYAKFYGYPGFHEPNGTSELIINRKVWNMLSQEHKNIIKNVASLSDHKSLAQITWLNGISLKKLQQKHMVKTFPFPKELISRANTISLELMEELSEKDQLFKKVWQSYMTAKKQLTNWTQLTKS